MAAGARARLSSTVVSSSHSDACAQEAPTALTSYNGDKLLSTLAKKAAGAGLRRGSRRDKNGERRETKSSKHTARDERRLAPSRMLRRGARTVVRAPSAADEHFPVCCQRRHGLSILALLKQVVGNH